MALLNPLWMQVGTDEFPIEYPLGEDRELFNAAVFAREGVVDVNGGHLLVTQRAAGADMSVDVAAGRCVIEGGEQVSGRGKYLCTSTTPVNVPISKPTSGTRAHLVYAQVRDKREAVAGGVTLSEWVISSTYDSANPTVAPTITDGIPIAIVTVTSSTTSVTNSLIGDRRKRTSTGTSAITGVWGETGIDHTYYPASDSTRPLTWLKNPDGWVTLSGWLRRATQDTTVRDGVFYTFDGGENQPTLPPEIRPTGIRDMIGLTSNGDIHYAIQPSGVIRWRFLYDTTLRAGEFPTWFTFDGLSYRSNRPF